MDNRLVIFILNGQRYALYLSAVERVVRAVEVTPLPKAPDIVCGIVNVQGRVIPVFNLRRRFHLPEREIAPSDQLIIAHARRRPVALAADAVSGVLEYSERLAVSAEDILPGAEHLEGVVKLEEGLVLIHDLERFLSLDEEAALERALRGG